MIEKNNNMGSKISVIVPVYNGEDVYLVVLIALFYNLLLIGN